ncbi:hypothetical protein [Streptomyces sp. B1I3]|uniref:hypothetical protein n=1 Tax=Streptomyces sp. B1I3 TaxID=3042264 RepID=UPI00277D4ACB|nr:hypothetical protein [Streptomyces sp. B1I3]MDQ0791933.1 hypothetical protein [Streptomyces sp. B1I3]
MTHRPYPNVNRALAQLDRHGRTLTAVPLTELTDQDLQTLASRFGGPNPDEFAEIHRRLAVKAETLGAALGRVGLRAALSHAV